MAARTTGQIVAMAAALLTLLSGCGAPSAGDGGSARPDDVTAPNAKPYPVRGIYDRDLAEQPALGFNFIDSTPYEDQMDRLAKRRLKGFVWLGGYSNETCTFNESDGWVRARVSTVARHRAVGAYFIDDEPDAARCPSAPGQMLARARLVRAIDPIPPTFLVAYKVEQLRRFAGSVDVLALDGYPCSIKHGCDFGRIGDQSAEADRLGVRYWGVVQAFGDDWYKQPSAEELHEQFRCWRATNMEGYLVFGWKWPRDAPDRWLARSRELKSQLRHENRLGPSDEAPSRCRIRR